MLSGVIKLYIALASDIYEKGFSVGGKRIGFALKQNVNWYELNLLRSSSGVSCDTKNFANSSVGIFYILGCDKELLKFHGKRIVCKYLTTEGISMVMGIDQPLTITTEYNAGSKIEDGIITKINLKSISLFFPEEYVPYLPDYPVNREEPVLWLRADSVELQDNFVKRLIDKSGNEYHGISSNYLGVTHIPNDINNKPAIHIDTTSMYVYETYIGNTALWGGGINALGFNDEYTILIVVKPLEYQETFFINSSNLIFKISTALKLTIMPRGAGDNFDLTDYFSYKLIAIRFPLNGNFADVHINNSLLGTVTAGTDEQKFTLAKIFIGLTNGTNQMKLAELRIWDRVLTDEQLSAITTEIMTYYAL